MAPSRRPNWYKDENPFNLPRPPPWFLDELYVFDSELVILPSRQERVYRLTRRTRRGPGIQAKFDSSSDTKMMTQYRVVPVTAIFPWTRWEREIFAALRRRDTWQFASPDQAEQAIQNHEAEIEKKKDAKLEDEVGQRATSMYDAWKLRTGQRVFGGVKNPQHRKVTPSRVVSKPYQRPAGPLLYDAYSRPVA